MDFNNNHEHNDNKNAYDLNSKIMLTAILSLSFVILLVVILHVYARCVLRHPRRHHQTVISPLIQSYQQPLPEPKSGLDPTVINSLPLFPYEQLDSQDELIECAVCISLLEEGELARRLPNCNHIFHVACIDRWLNGQSTCPICRSEAAPRLAPLDREPPMGREQVQLHMVVVVSEGDHDHNHNHSNDGRNHNHDISKVDNPSGSSAAPGSSSSFRLSSFRRMLGRDRSTSSSRRIQVRGELDLD